MEKYAIDIDKVLDEFEEKEALTTDIVGSEEPKKLLRNVSDKVPSYFDEKLPANFQQKENFFPLPNSTKHEHENPKCGTLDNSLIFTNDDCTLPENSLLFNSKTEFVSKTEISDCNNELSISVMQKRNLHCTIDCNSKHLNSDIPFETISENSYTNFDTCPPDKECSSKPKICEKNGCSEEALCTSVKETGADLEKLIKLPLENLKNFNIKQEFEPDDSSEPLKMAELEDGNSFVSHDAGLDLTISTFKANNITTNQKALDISAKNLSTNVSDKNICKESTEINEVQKFSLDFHEDNKDAEQSSVDTSGHSFDYINNLCSNASVINDNSTSLNCNKLCTETNCHIENFVSNCNDSELNQNDVEPLLLNNVGGNLPDTLSFKFPSMQVPESWKVTNGTDAFDAKVSSNFSQDDDSGVSSQEDISSNSPSELPPNRSSSSTNKKNYLCHKATISKLISHQNGTSEGFENLTAIETPATFIEDTNQTVEISESQCDKLEFVQPITDENNYIKISQDIKSDVELDSSLNNNQNTSPNVSLLESSELVMPSSETNNCIESFQDAENRVCVPSITQPDIKENTLLSETFDSVQSSNSIANRTNSEVFAGDSCKFDLPDSDIIANDSEYIEKSNGEVKNDTLLCKHVVPSDSLNQDMEILSNSNHNNFENNCHVSEIVSEFSDGLECEQIDICERSVDGNINPETIVADDETNHCEVSPRLQRPTSLNLPSLQFQSSELPDESEFNGRSEEQQIEETISPIMPVDEPNVENTCIKQQQQIGFIKPYWIPDGEAFNCMHCALKFTVIRRRHHCRACGKVLCSRCCNQRAYLAYMNKEDRICQPCAEVLSSSNTLALLNEQIPTSVNSPSSSSCGSSPNFSPAPQVSSVSIEDKAVWRPHPNNPDDYCSTIPPLQQMELSGQKPPPTVMVPIGVLKRGNKRRREPKQVIFSDGIRPGGDLTDLTEPMETAPVYRRTGRKRVDKIFSENSKETSTISSVRSQQKFRQKRFLVSDENGPLPPIMLPQDLSKEDTVEWSYILQLLLDEEQKPVKFLLIKNLYILVKLTKLDCCFGKECWCFTSDGFCSVGQDEVMIILERTPNETMIPRDIFKIFTHIYDNASKGSIIEELGHTIFTDEILGSSDHRGFLFVRPSFQCLSKLTVPTTPYLVAILIHKWEVPWAKVFPLRLMLRMGAECRYYPCSLVSVRNRKPIFFEIGQTIMNVLADLRNYQFTIPVVPGLVVHMEEKKTFVNIPRNRYEKVMKVLKSNNVEHVLALGSNFSSEADSHLVCMQKEEGDYQTQAINIENTTRRVTGASFIVFSGALKSTSGLTAKFSIVEDGLLIQISQETMMALHVALRDMKDLTIECGHVGASEPDEIVIIQWTRDDKKFNLGVRSPIDGKSFEGVSNLRIHTSTDYAGENYLIRWTEVFFLDVEENGNSIQNELVDPCRLAETVAQSCCMALTPFLDQLAEADLLKIGLRVTLDTEKDRVGYDIGARGKMLPSAYMTALDNSLIPVILRLSNITQKEKLSFELIFHILIK